MVTNVVIKGKYKILSILSISSSLISQKNNIPQNLGILKCLVINIVSKIELIVYFVSTTSLDLGIGTVFDISNNIESPLLYNNMFTIVKKEKELKNTEKIDYGKKYSEKIFKKSNGMIVVLKYYGSKSNAEVGCLKCNHRWKIRADHLVSRCYCPNCRKSGK